MRNRVYLALDVLLAIAAIALAFAARFEGWRWWAAWHEYAIAYAAACIPVRLVIGWRGGLYSRLWRYSGIADLQILAAVAAVCVVASMAIGLFGLPALGLVDSRLPIGVLVLDAALTPFALAVPRLTTRYRERRRRLRRRGHATDTRRVLVAGGGAAGQMIVKEMLETPDMGRLPVAFIDDDMRKHGKRINGLPVAGPLVDLTEVASRYQVDEVVIAMPSAPGRVVREVVNAATAIGLPTRTVPGLFEIISGAKAVSALRRVAIEDLLRREHVSTEVASLAAASHDKVVLVTGAGGSIGSELCRQIARVEPAVLVLLGRGENSIFEIQQELHRTFPKLHLEPVIADVRDADRMRQVFEHFAPSSVYHAAAHKHVPLMEANIPEAILNNVLGTRNVASNAAAIGSERFVLVSTDKAVRPTSIMGASKRIAEQVVHQIAESSGRQFVSVRFGNVLGSRGSVVPTFLRQIAAGGPVTITHPEMTRYFMTIPEAVTLVLQAGSLGRAGDVLVLDMGEPVKIVDLAEDLIRLSGLELGTDIEIQFTGLRPGEKLYEELFFDDANATRTTHPKILRARESTVGTSSIEHIDALIEVARRCGTPRELRRMIRALVPDYQGQRDSQELILATGGGLPQAPARRPAVAAS